MKKIWGVGALLLSCGVGLAQLACSAGKDEGIGPVGGAHKMDDLIGSVPVTSKSLDGIGSIGLVYDYSGYGGYGGYAGFVDAGPSVGGSASAPVPARAGSTGTAGSTSSQSPFYPQCTGTLISKNSVLTSRSCAQLFEQTQYYGYSSLKFVIGADATRSNRRIDVVDVEYAPAVSSNGGSFYPDIAVLHLGESVSDVAAFPVALLTDDLIGKALAGVGFGNSDLRYQNGARRAGSLTLQATSGLLYPLLFGSFEDFYQYALSNGYYPGPYYAVDGVATGTAGSAAGGFPGIGGSPSVPPEGIGGAIPIPSAGTGGSFGGSPPSAGSAGILVTAGFGGAGPNDWYRQYLQQQYDSVELGPGEAYLGGTNSDAQPCGADQGGPLVRKLQGQVRVFGVFSRTPLGSCDKGGVYAGIDTATQAFIDEAAQWVDPCAGFTGYGKCVGTTATRCSTVAEGKRRMVKFDCSLLNQVCVAPGISEVACTDK
ncbi:MAG TPA: trypsin-like serine protease [Polyangiaceae bacterium]|nr:trypsin-like serine protease [Polyangiaceae bacterium]